jgi:hypothetical protein
VAQRTRDMSLNDWFDIQKCRCGSWVADTALHDAPHSN